MKHATANSLKLLVLELFLYAALIVGYYFLVLHFLGPTLKDIYDHQRRLYAGLALGLIIGQGFLLEILTRGLLAWVSPRTDDR